MPAAALGPFCARPTGTSPRTKLWFSWGEGTGRGRSSTTHAHEEIPPLGPDLQTWTHVAQRHARSVATLAPNPKHPECAREQNGRQTHPAGHPVAERGRVTVR